LSPAPEAAPDDSNFFTRFYHAYVDEWGMAAAPVDPNAPPARQPAGRRLGRKRIGRRGIAVVAGFRRADVAARVEPAINLDMLVMQSLADHIARADRIHERAIDRIGRRFADIVVAALGPIREGHGRRTYAWDNYTNEGLQSSLKLTQNWELQLGVSMSTETTVWNQTHISLINPTTGFPGYQGPRDPGAQPSVTGCVQYESNTAWDNIYLCADGINNGKWGYNNLQWFGGTYYHKFNDQWHISMESRYMVGKDLPDVSQGLGNTAFAYILPTNHPNEAICSSGQTQCTAKAVTFLFHLNYQFSAGQYFLARGIL
jgi:hypothetical protein